MEEKEPIKVKLSTAILLIIILILIAVIVYFVLQNNIISNSKQVQEAQNSNVSNISKTVKIYEDRDWVYDADYKRDVVAESYTTSYNEKYYAKDIIVPFININSEYATTANTQIKEVFDSAIKTYNKGANSKIEYVDECKYEKYLSDDNLSVILTYGVGATSVVHPMYYAYNFDLKTGNKLSYEDVYKLAGLNANNIDSKVEDAITATMKEKYADGIDFNKYNKESINNYKKSVSDGTLIYFLSKNGELNVVVKLSIPADTGEFDTIIKIDEDENKTTDKYTEITSELNKEEKLFITNVEKDKEKYSLKGVIYKPYSISKNEYNKIISNGKMEYTDNYNPEKTTNYTVKKDKENGNRYALFHPKHRRFC